jgi:hypothetical protein
VQDFHTTILWQLVCVTLSSAFGSSLTFPYVFLVCGINIAILWESNLCMIQVDIGGHPHFPNGSKQFSGHFGNLLFLAGFHFRGHFEGLNEVFSRSRFSMIAEGMIEPPK